MSTLPMSTRAETLAQAPPFQAYAYAYPHKTAYRPLAAPISLEEAWRDERKDALFLYVHVPFCEFRCGFCNLFTQSNPTGDFVESYLRALGRQARRVKEALPSARFARFAIGGGTPTHLEAKQLEALLDLARDVGAPLGAIPGSVEMSPETATREKLCLLRARGVTRASLGVQTFDEAEARAASRPQSGAQVERALDAIREAGFPVLNVDLIYGLPGQTRASWLASIDRALRVEPEELYLYPLYVRPLTGLGLSDREWDDQRLALLRAGRAHLLERGYEQVSLRMFRRTGSTDESGPVYCCQEDGMLGLGCGARSYTRALHWSSEYAVGAKGVKAILERWIAREDLGSVEYGFALDPEDQRRRFAIQSLLQQDGLSLMHYARRFATSVLGDLPELGELVALGWATLTDTTLALTEAGLERSDAIGPFLYSKKVARLMEAYELR